MEANIQNEFSEIRMDTDKADDVLEHFGIMGMKWGIRRFQPYSTRGRRSGKRGKEIGEAAKVKVNKRVKAKAAPFKTKRQEDRFSKKNQKIREKQMKEDVKNRHLLSYKELERKVNRLELEKKLREYTAVELGPSKKIVKDVLNDAGKKVAADIIEAAIKTAARKAAGEENVTSKSFAEYLRPKHFDRPKKK